MATIAPITAGACANIHSRMQRAIAFFAPHQAPAPRPVNATITDLRLVLRRIEHAQREHGRWDARYLSQTIRTAVIRPLAALSLPDVDRLLHGAAFALAPVAAIGTDRRREDVDVDAEFAEAARLIREAIADAEAAAHRLN